MHKLHLLKLKIEFRLFALLVLSFYAVALNLWLLLLAVIILLTSILNLNERSIWTVPNVK